MCLFLNVQNETLFNRLSNVTRHDFLVRVLCTTWPTRLFNVTIYVYFIRLMFYMFHLNKKCFYACPLSCFNHFYIYLHGYFTLGFMGFLIGSCINLCSYKKLLTFTTYVSNDICYWGTELLTKLFLDININLCFAHTRQSNKIAAAYTHLLFTSIPICSPVTMWNGTYSGL